MKTIFVLTALVFSTADAKQITYENVPTAYVAEKSVELCVQACVDYQTTLNGNGCTILSVSKCSDEWLSQKDRDEGYVSSCKISFVR
ncbi:MAG: hypothetical protein A4S09_16555 [Proteobacteria bacterium SG_bin7]|nr:MAG: hypothetical protein A4S09_16555 [Proteobacteria bacterium SG_bin7]